MWGVFTYTFQKILSGMWNMLHASRKKGAHITQAVGILELTDNSYEENLQSMFDAFPNLEYAISFHTVHCML